MKKLFAIMAIVALMTSCKGKKKDDKTVETTTTTTSTDTAGTTTTTTTASTDVVPADIPKFADADVQKFVNDYSAWAVSYKAGIADPAKAQAMAADAQKWSTQMTSIAMKIGSDPKELQKWTEWAKWLSAQMMPGK